MGLFGRRREEQACDPQAFGVTGFAVPLTPREAQFLVLAAREENRAARERSWAYAPGPGRSAMARSNALLQTAGYCAAVGQRTVPLAVHEIDVYEMVAASIRQHGGSARVAGALEQVTMRLRVLAGAAVANHWLAGFDGLGCRWVEEPAYEPQRGPEPDLPGITS